MCSVVCSFRDFQVLLVEVKEFVEVERQQSETVEGIFIGELGGRLDVLKHIDSAFDLLGGWCS